MSPFIYLLIVAVVALAGYLLLQGKKGSSAGQKGTINLSSSETPTVPEMPEQKETPVAPMVPQAPVVPPDVPVAPEAPAAPDAPVAPEAPPAAEEPSDQDSSEV